MLASAREAFLVFFFVIGFIGIIILLGNAVKRTEGAIGEAKQNRFTEKRHEKTVSIRLITNLNSLASVVHINGATPLSYVSKP
jgi:hypothetical protein